ncbi:hypothetical protein HK101_005686 [Irineochytrium annulatum]|nr:hypothetical protein HK101_005686 [Irineochytrium annulatum]
MRMLLSVTVSAACLGLLAPRVLADVLDSNNTPILANNANGSIINFGSFQNIESGFDAFAGALSLLWSIENVGTDQETFHGLLLLNGTKAVRFAKSADNTPGVYSYTFNPEPGNPDVPSLSNAWAGIGFGRSMLTADFVVMHANPNVAGGVALQNMVSTGAYQAPVVNPRSNALMNAPVGSPPHVSFIGQGVIMAEFRRLTKAQDAAHATIPAVAEADVIWAYNMNPKATPAEKWKTFHGNNRGSYRLFFQGNGEAGPTMEQSLYAKKVHGVGMFIVWQLILPFGVYWARYARSIARINAHWMWIHIVIQSVGSLAVIGLFLYVVASLQVNSNFGPSSYIYLLPRPHPILGWIIVISVLIQVTFGVFNRLGLQVEVLAENRRTFQLLHDWFGRLLLVASVSQVALGINTLFPWPDTLPSYYNRGFYLWIAYFAFSAFWLLAFLLTELYWMMRVANSDRGLAFSKTNKVGKFNKSGVDPQLALLQAASKRMPEKSPLMEMSAPGRTIPTLNTFTWNDIDRALIDGHMLVVANGRYVYDINQWIWSHPGGQIILYAVAGTDITNDYFHEAGFDADAFVPAQIARKGGNRRLPAGPVGGGQPMMRPPPNMAGMPTPPPQQAFPSLSEAEWRQVVRARRPHVHSRLAIEKLSTLIVGELVGEGNTPAYSEADGALFSPLEFRRYALVDSVIVSGNRTMKPVFRLKFCILYPHDTRANEPKAFLPGQCVEMQAKIGHTYVSRYFTPYTGSPACFECYVKLDQAGEFTPNLLRQKIGDRQIRVRGPFGTPMVHPDRLLDPITGERTFRRTLFITAGSGLAPALQMAEYLFLPTFVPLYVYQGYDPVNADEIELREGDWVISRSHLFDGWCEGVNLRTGHEGIFPLPVTYPRGGPGNRLAVLQSVSTVEDAFGGERMRGCLLAYPSQIRVVTNLTRGVDEHGGDAAREAVQARCAGEVRLGRLTVDDIGEAVRSIGWPQDEYGRAAGEEEERDKALSKVIVCGPRQFEAFVYDALDSLVPQASIDSDLIMSSGGSGSPLLPPERDPVLSGEFAIPVHTTSRIPPKPPARIKPPSYDASSSLPSPRLPPPRSPTSVAVVPPPRSGGPVIIPSDLVAIDLDASWRPPHFEKADVEPTGYFPGEKSEKALLFDPTASRPSTPTPSLPPPPPRLMSVLKSYLPQPERDSKVTWSRYTLVAVFVFVLLMCGFETGLIVQEDQLLGTERQGDVKVGYIYHLAFIAAQCFGIYVTWDAVVQQNIIQIFAIIIFEFGNCIFSIIQIGQDERTFNGRNNSDGSTADARPLHPLEGILVSISFFWLVILSLNPTSQVGNVVTAVLGLPLVLIALICAYLAPRRESLLLVLLVLVSNVIMAVYVIAYLAIVHMDIAFTSLANPLTMFGVVALLLLVGSSAFAFVCWRAFGSGLKEVLRQQMVGKRSAHRKSSTRMNLDE